jgi:hypothetical protein
MPARDDWRYPKLSQRVRNHALQIWTFCLWPQIILNIAGSLSLFIPSKVSYSLTSGWMRACPASNLLRTDGARQPRTVHRPQINGAAVPSRPGLASALNHGGTTCWRGRQINPGAIRVDRSEEFNLFLTNHKAAFVCVKGTQSVEKIFTNRQIYPLLRRG